MPEKELHLEIDSHVVIQLGAELISDSEQALLELVKNAYDGDATRCTIVIDPDWIPEPTDDSWNLFSTQVENGQRIGKIVVEDNGVGLNEYAVTHGWLRISASLKRPTSGLKEKTARNRVPVGDKGLGRLATMRLGNVLLLRTKTTTDRQARTVSFSWTDFKPGAPLNDVPVRVGISSSLRSRDHGTDVEIQGLIEPLYWNNTKNVDGVIAKLSSLISPFKRLQDFQVFLRVDNLLRDLQSLSAEALNQASAKFSFRYADGRLESRGWYSKTLFRGGSGRDNQRQYEELLSDAGLPEVMKFFASDPKFRTKGYEALYDESGGWLFSLQDSISWSDIPRDTKLPGAKDPGPFAAEIYYVLFNEPTRQALQAAGIPAGLLQEMTSVGIFRDGFRIRMSDDWLEISKGVTSGGFFQLRPRNVIGYFELTNERNPNLIEKSDREGWVDNEYSRGFMLVALRAKKFANDSLELVRTAFNAYKAKKYENTAPQSAEPEPDSVARFYNTGIAARDALSLAKRRGDVLAKRVDAIQNTLGQLQGPSGEKVGDAVSTEMRAVGTALADFQFILNEAESSATATVEAARGAELIHQELSERNLRLIDAAAVGLSARALTHEINSHVSMIDSGLAKVRRANQSKTDKRLTDAIELIGGAVRELRKSVASINPLLSGSRTLKDNFYAGDAVREFLQLRASRIAEAKVTVEVVGGKGPYIRFGRARFNQVLENLLQNSLYWIDEHSATEKRVQRTIQIEIDKIGFTWWDGAKGVREQLEESLFEPYVSDKPESRGQGLGLYLITAFLQAEKCDITLLSDRNVFGRRYKFRVDFSGALQ